jgi:hypothetical protein
MKKNILLFVIITLALLGKAQTVTFKPTLGSNILVQEIKDLGIKGKKGIKPGVDIGLIAELPIKNTLFFEAGFFYSLSRGSLHRLFIYPFPTTGDLPEVVEDFNLNLLKVPVNILLKKKNGSSGFFGAGLLAKFNLGANRDGKVVDRDERYSSKFTIDTKHGHKTGIGIVCIYGKQFKLGNQTVSLRLSYDTELSNWRYPTNFDLEKHTYYSMRTHNFTLLFSWLLSTRSKK